MSKCDYCDEKAVVIRPLKYRDATVNMCVNHLNYYYPEGHICNQ